MDAPPRVNILGVGISAINMPMALATIEGWIARRDPSYVCVAPVHTIIECQRDSALRDVVNRSGLTTPDGMPLVWLSRLHGSRYVDRVYGPDLMLALCERSVARAYRHFLYGGGPGVADALATRLRQRFPGLEIVGTYAPPFRPMTVDEEADVARRIDEAAADVVWVGLGTPKQDRWIAEHVGQLSAPVLIGVGAAFDFLSGRKRQAPRSVQRSGLEWLFRLSQEPRRLWYRYLVYNPLFIALVLAQLSGLRQFPPVPGEGRATGRGPS
jgi:N-acetylglucosaminyldiphosphoundecaprenol N-acetyl-beta-D-mannosaminyltransferase